MAMDKQQMEKERELFAAVRQQEAMNSLRQLQLGNSMQEPAAQQQTDPSSGQMQPQPMQGGMTGGLTTGIGGNPSQPTGGSLLQGFHEQATQSALGILGYIEHLVSRNDLNEDIKAGAIHTAAQAIAQLIGLQNQQTDIAPQDKLALETQKMQAEHQLKAADLQHQHQLDQQKLQLEGAKAAQQMELERSKAEAEQQRGQQSHEQTLAMNADNHQFNQKLQTAKLQLAAQQADKQQQSKTKPAK